MILNFSDQHKPFSHDEESCLLSYTPDKAIPMSGIEEYLTSNTLGRLYNPNYEADVQIILDSGEGNNPSYEFTSYMIPNHNNCICFILP